MRRTISEVDELQKRWGNKPCNHDRGYGHEIDDVGCDCDCFCLQCGFRHTYPDFFEKRMGETIAQLKEKC